MGPSSKDGFHGFPPAAMALAIVSSTCALLSADKQVSTSVVFVASLISPLMTSLKRLSTRSMTKMLLSTTMHAASSSENSGLNLKPTSVKNPLAAFRSLTGKFTKIIRMAFPPGSGSGSRSARPGLCGCGSVCPRRSPEGQFRLGLGLGLGLVDGTGLGLKRGRRDDDGGDQQPDGDPEPQVVATGQRGGRGGALGEQVIGAGGRQRREC